MDSALPLLGLGFVLGLKHATEADHLVAVSTIISEYRSVWRAAAVGALWGLGHTASLFAAGGMLLMSTLISLPFVLTAQRFRRIDTPVRLLAGAASVLFGLYYAWQTTAGAR